MKITKVTPWLVSAPSPYLDTANDSRIRNREYVYVEVNTDEGVTGWGEIRNISSLQPSRLCLTQTRQRPNRR